jgi:hypothetical protein
VCAGDGSSAPMGDIVDGTTGRRATEREAGGAGKGHALTCGRTPRPFLIGVEVLNLVVRIELIFIYTLYNRTKKHRK